MEKSNLKITFLYKRNKKQNKQIIYKFFLNIRVKIKIIQNNINQLPRNLNIYKKKIYHEKYILKSNNF